MPKLEHAQKTVLPTFGSVQATLSGPWIKKNGSTSVGLRERQTTQWEPLQKLLAKSLSGMIGLMDVLHGLWAYSKKVDGLEKLKYLEH